MFSCKKIILVSN
jgi:serine/threonine protein kinase